MAKTLEYLNQVLRGASSAGWASPSLLLRYAIIVVAIGGISFAYAFSAGWVGWPVHRAPLSATRVVNAFEATTGPHPGFRRNHAKGICIAGHFDSNGAGAALSRARVFAPGVVPIVGRFSVPGTNPSVADGESRLRSLALRFAVPDGEEWRTAMNSVPIFSVRTPDEFVAELAAQREDKGTGKPDPARVAEFEAQHPEARAFRAWTRTHPASSGFDNATYYGVSAFRFVKADGTSQYVRWSMVPEVAYEPVAAAQRRDPDFLAHRLVNTLRQGPLRWHLILAVARPGDAIDDSTQLWVQTPDRLRVDAGTLVVESAQAQIDGRCRNIDFDPLILPAGIEPSGDPLLSARAATYMESFYRRMSEEVRYASKR
ncbi:catalase family peroxidase [Paraburkholderia solisilvae]|uniref:Catalase-related peroxidase n=1 Tax=Paraburkholderia solisilvae TaxID=624376 RepID=A0A6J5CXX4_9BURK|nr:catalase family peroxidase [Paraburkholderia solisilvae]CAB3746839.1 Catalase-related peroxidase [Paraburkholderia solisilvae]